MKRWQRLHGRHGLPWQDSRDPYRVWLSEVMLQQTQVATVLVYYARFLARFPTLQHLAAASQDDVLALWSGLGYYSRARNLHRCAQQLVQQHGGVFPDTAQALETLPGIGRSTAAAIAVFCFERREAILDGNVKRVLSRALGFEQDLAQMSAVQVLWEKAQAELPRQGLTAYTQGLMDLGAGVCTLRRPLCAACPLQTVCVAHQQGRPEQYPVKSRRAKRSRRSHALLCLQQGQRWYLVQRPQQGVWAGLWSLPELADAQALQALVAAWPGHGDWLPVIEHALTHFDWTLQPLWWRLPAEPSKLPGPVSAALQALQASGSADTGSADAGRWWRADEALALGLSTPVRRLLQTVINDAQSRSVQPLPLSP